MHSTRIAVIFTGQLLIIVPNHAKQINQKKNYEFKEHVLFLLTVPENLRSSRPFGFLLQNLKHPNASVTSRNPGFTPTGVKVQNNIA